MAWNLAAAGDCPTEHEEALRAALAGVLSRPEYGTAVSSLHGETVGVDPLHAEVSRGDHQPEAE